MFFSELMLNAQLRVPLFIIENQTFPDVSFILDSAGRTIAVIFFTLRTEQFNDFLVV